MSKNLTRKGLALGAVLALGSSLFAGAPAFAGTESAKITLAPSLGTTYTSIAGAYFELKNELDPTIKSAGLENKNAGKLTFLVGNAGAAKLSIDLVGSTNAVLADNIKVLSSDTTDMTGTTTGETGIASVALSSQKYFAVIADPATQSTDTSDIGANTLRLTTTSDATDAVSVTVQAFIDDNSNGEIDTFELTSPVRTVTFKPTSTVSPTVAISSAVIGTTTLKGTVALGSEINGASLAGQVKIGFFRNGSAQKMNNGSSSVDQVDLAWDSTNSYLSNTGANQYTVASVDNVDKIIAASYTAKAYFGNPVAVLGSASSAVSPVAGTVTSADATADLVATATTNVIKASTTTTTVRSGYTGAVALTSTVQNGSAADVKIAGIKVKVTLTKGTTFGAAHTVTAGSVTLTATSGAVSYETTTDALGAVAVSATSNKGTAGDSYSVKIQVLTDNAGYEAGDTNTVTFADATIAKIALVQAVGTGAELSVAKGGSLALNYEVRDNYGALSSVAGTYRFELASSSVTGGGSVSGVAALSGGKASYTVVDNTVASTGKYTVTATLKKLNTAGDAYDTTILSGVAVVVNVGTSAVGGLTVPADASSSLTLEPKDFVSHDLRLDTNTKTSTTIGVTSGNGFTVSGSVTDASGAVVPGQAVTISAKGLQFVADNTGSSDATYALDSITVYANASGAYSVKAYSHTAGDVTITAKSGSVSKTVVAKYAFASTANDDSKLTITGAGITKSGRSTGYVVALTDKWGNAIKGAVTIKVEQSGAGYLVSTPTAVSAVDGKTNVTLITQPADGGLTTLTVTYDSDTDVVATKAILVGVSASITKAATSKVTIKNAAGLTVKVVRGTKSATKTATSDSYKVSLKGGNGTVSVYVNGVKVASK
jgi:hypothetical protein